MKKYIPVILFLMLTSTLMAQNTPIAAWQEKWNNSENYLIEIAQAMPQEKYTFKPTEREMTFADQLLHIANNINWLSNTYFNGEKIDKYQSITSKEETIAILHKAFTNGRNAIGKTNPEDLIAEVEFFAGSKTKLQILNLLQDHVTHHRGQVIVYLNLNDITPPRYIGW
ncbi:hypothetical protein NBRC110019_21860 [Neptunitalea chrysea]|uniref:DinB family protein n=1 Tax=Neptunitalea chrysea TaxID=1647581 RepID=A0A9W6B5F6_9FLAO|nr:DinB family protein [Neptunitalea chrysea]GLB53146.1 hypothetical protein NBRC110019_21860 [Neptunitalea chrysea]